MSADMRTLAETRLREAQVLLAGGEASGAYYLAGYAVECGLKACITARFQPYLLPDKKLVADSYTHNLDKLLDLAELRPDLVQRQKAGDDFGPHWAAVKDWTVDSRYEIWSVQAATNLLDAVAPLKDGVLPWIGSKW